MTQYEIIPFAPPKGQVACSNPAMDTNEINGLASQGADPFFRPPSPATEWATESRRPGPLVVALICPRHRAGE